MGRLPSADLFSQLSPQPVEGVQARVCRWYFSLTGCGLSVGLLAGSPLPENHSLAPSKEA